MLGPALAVLLTLPGVPCVYYGDELAWEGRVDPARSGDDAVRPPLPATAVPTGARQADALRLHRELIALRRRSPWLTRANLELGEVSNPRIAYTVASSTGPERLLVTVDLTGDAAPPAGWGSRLEGAGWSVAVPA